MLSTTSPPLSYLHFFPRREPFNLEFTKSVDDFDSFAFTVLDYLMSVWTQSEASHHLILYSLIPTCIDSTKNIFYFYMYCGNRLAQYLYKNRKQPNPRCLWKRILIQSMTAKRELRFTFLFLFYYDLNWQNKKDSTHLSKMVVLLGILKTLIRKFHSHFFYSPFPKGYIQWKQCQSREWSWCIALPFPFLIII